MLRVLLIALTASLARAAPAPASPMEIAAARQLARQGMRLAEAGDCAAAVAPLSRAEALFPAPTIRVRLAECYLSLGKLVLGTEGLRRVAVEDLGPTPSRAFVAARARALTLLAEAEPRLGHLTVHVVGPAPGAVRVTLDSEGVSPAMLEVDLPVDPGEHRVKAEAEGFDQVERTITVLEGAIQQVELMLPRSSDLPPSAGSEAPPKLSRLTSPTPPLETTAAPTSRSSAPALRVPALVALVVGVVGMGVGAGFGVVALRDKARLDAVCLAQLCPLSSRGDLDLLRRDATVSTIGWTVGAVAAAASVLLAVLLANASATGQLGSPSGESSRGATGHAAWLALTDGGFEVRW
jgi:hypothetical protein